MNQKFHKLSFVNVKDFGTNFSGIIDGSMTQIFGGKRTDKYRVFVVKQGHVKSRAAWVSEGRMSLASDQDSALAESMIEEYMLTVRSLESSGESINKEET